MTNQNSKLSTLTITKTSEMLGKGEITSVELTEYYLNKIKKLNPKINAFISILETEALAAAAESDKRRATGETLSILDGIPVAIKDNMAMKGTKTTAASKMLEKYVSPYDATVVSKLKKAGAVIIGKTNMDEFAMGSSTETSHFGPTKNPWDLERVPGGSSGGSAAAVAADLCVAALGSDTGGSIRQPSSLCGTVGLKPTYGTVSRYGLFAMASSLDQIGPITKTAQDAQIIYDIIKGYDEKDATSINSKSETRNLPDGKAGPKQGQNLKFKIKNLKLGVPREYFAEGLDEGVKKVIEEAIETLKKAGAEIVDISLPNSKYALSCYYIIMPVEVSSNLNRYVGVGFGLKSREDGFGAEAKRRIMLGTYASSAGYADKFYGKAQKVRSIIQKDFEKAFEKVDFILGPVSPTTAFILGEKTIDPLKMYLSDIYTIAVNLAGVPAASIPAGIIPNQNKPNPGMGLPVGLHIIGQKNTDEQIIELAKIFEGVRSELPRAPLQS